MRFHRVCLIVMLLVFSGSPESRTQRHPVISRVWATGPRLPFARHQCPFISVVGLGWHALRDEGRGGRPRHAFATIRDVPPSTNVSLFQVGMAGLEPASPCSQSTWVRRYPTSRQSVRTGGSEPPISWPPTRRDTQASLRSVFSDPYRSRTGLAAVKRQCPQTDRRTGPPRRIFSTQLTRRIARTFHAVGRAVLESASAAFQAAATPSQLPVQQKKPDVLMTPGFRYSSECAAQCHMRNG